MKCRKCQEKASIRMPQHHLALCKDHYLEWLPEQTERFIQKYRMFTRQQRLLVAVSGGKDSLSLWDILWRSGYQADGVYIHLGIDGGMAYSRQSQEYAGQFASARGLNLRVVEVEEQYGETVPQIARRTRRGQDRPCAVCGISKRHILNQAALDGSYDVLVTAHNLDDEASVLMGNTLTWLEDQLVRQSPVLEAAPGLVRKAKPFCRFYERETAAYALLREIPYIYDECPFSIGSKLLYYKKILNQLESDRPGAKLIFYLNFLQAGENGLFRDRESSQTGDLHPCPNCGQPTSSEGLCAFCRQTSLK